jgi:hypothetical protein
MQDSHDGALCASLGHYVAGITLAYCPHKMAWVAVIRAGDEADDSSWRWRRLDFGPFDGADDVARQAHAELDRLLRADLAGWKATRGREAAGEPTTEP